MIDVPELMIRPTTEACGTVWLDTPAKSVKEHLSIVICGLVDKWQENRNSTPPLRAGWYP